MQPLEHPEGRNKRSFGFTPTKVTKTPTNSVVPNQINTEYKYNSLSMT